MLSVEAEICLLPDPKIAPIKSHVGQPSPKVYCLDPLWSDRLLHLIWFLESFPNGSCSSPVFGSVTSCDLVVWRVWYQPAFVTLFMSWTKKGSAHIFPSSSFIDQSFFKTGFGRGLYLIRHFAEGEKDYLSFVCLQTCSCPARLPLGRARGWAVDQSFRQRLGWRIWLNRSPPELVRGLCDHRRHLHLQRSCVLKWQACVARRDFFNLPLLGRSW